MKHKDNHQVSGDDEHCQEENNSYFQQAGAEVLRVANVQQAEGFCAMVQLSCVHLVQGALGRTIRVLVPWGPSSAKDAHSTAAPDRHGGGVRARCLPYQQQHEPLVLSVHSNPFTKADTCINSFLRRVTHYKLLWRSGGESSLNSGSNSSSREHKLPPL